MEKMREVRQEIDGDINSVRKLWGKIIEKYNELFPHSSGFLTDKERIKIAGDIFRNLEQYRGILK